MYSLVESGIDQQQDEYLKKSDITCGVQSEAIATARIINGKPTTKNYPWLARVYIKVINTKH